MLISLNACKKDITLTDDFQLWGKPICFNEEVKAVISDSNIDYILKHNEMLGVKSCEKL